MHVNPNPNPNTYLRPSGTRTRTRSLVSVASRSAESSPDKDKSRPVFGLLDSPPPRGLLDEDFLCAHWGVSRGLRESSSAVADFVTFGHTILLTWVQIMCLESCRRHRKLRSYLTDWAELYDRAEAADQSVEFQSYVANKGMTWDLRSADGHGPLCAWVERECALIMTAYLFSSARLELLKPPQFRMIYWYVDFLLGIALQNTKLLDGPGGIAVLGGRKGAQSAARYPEVIVREIATIEVQKAIAQGVLRLVAGLAIRDDGESPPADPDRGRQGGEGGVASGDGRGGGGAREGQGAFNSERECFHQRFSAFHRLVRPDPLVFRQYEESVDLEGVEAAHMLKLSADAFGVAARLVAASVDQGIVGPRGSRLEEDFARMARVAQQNQLGISLLERLGERGREMKVTWDFSQHPAFPTIKLSR